MERNEPFSGKVRFTNRIHAIAKLILLLLVIPVTCVIKLLVQTNLTTSIFLLLLLALIIALYAASDVSFRYVWKNLRFYLITILLLIVALFAFIDLGLLLTRGLQAYLCFVNIILAGFLFISTSNPSDITLFLMQDKRLRAIALPLLAATRVMYILNSELQDLRDVQKQRGATFSLNPLKLDKTIKSFTALLIPALITCLNVSDRIARTLIVRGYSSERSITKPPFLKLKKMDYWFILFAVFIFSVGIFV